MNEHGRWRFLVMLVVIACLGGFNVADVDTAVAVATSSVKTLDRNLEPVILTGNAVSALSGFSVDQLFVYAYTDGGWRQIPAQVDEVTAENDYTATEDGLLDTNDEIVFMAKDLGDQVPSSVPITGSLHVSSGWYEIEVTDPISPTRKGWAYLVHSTLLTPTFTADYVGFDPATHRINGETFDLGFATPRPWADYLTLGGNGVDILDRTKMRLFCQKKLDPRTWLCPITEDEGVDLQDDLVKDGPVRVIVRGGRVLAYGSMARWTTALDIPSYLEGDIRFSIDFNPAVTGAIYYNAVVPDGVTVDGSADNVPAYLLSPWWQLSTDSGAFIQVADTTPIGGTQANYYKDDAAVDESDTGDQRSYGDAGVYVFGPNLVFAYTFSIYTLAGAQPNVGASYEAFFRQPLSVNTQLYGDPRPNKIYLPLVIR